MGIHICLFVGITREDKDIGADLNGKRDTDVDIDIDIPTDTVIEGIGKWIGIEKEIETNIIQTRLWMLKYNRDDDKYRDKDIVDIDVDENHEKAMGLKLQM